MLSILSYVSGLFVCPPWRNICSGPLPFFLNWVACLPGVELCEFCIYFGDQTPVRGIICKYIFLYDWFPFYFTALSFSCADAFYFDGVPFVYSFLYVPCSRKHIGKNTAAWNTWDFSRSSIFPPLGPFLSMFSFMCHNLYLSLLSTLSLFLCIV